MPFFALNRLGDVVTKVALGLRLVFLIPFVRENFFIPGNLIPFLVFNTLIVNLGATKNSNLVTQTVQIRDGNFLLDPLDGLLDLSFELSLFILLVLLPVAGQPWILLRQSLILVLDI